MRNIYRAKNSLKVSCLTFLAFSLFCSFGVWKGIPVAGNTWLDLAIGIMLVCVGGGIAAQTLTIRVVVNEESISYWSIFRRRLMLLNQIRYRREYEEYQDVPDGGSTVHYLELIPYDGERHSLKISKDDFDFDQAFWEWVSRVPDLEQLEAGWPRSEF